MIVVAALFPVNVRPRGAGYGTLTQTVMSLPMGSMRAWKNVLV